MKTKSLTPFLWLFAFLCSLFLINEWQLELFGIATITLFGWAIVTLSQHIRNGWKVPQSWVIRFLGLFWLLAFISILHTDILNVSVMAFCFFSALPLSFFVLTIHGQTADKNNFEAQLKLMGSFLGFVFAGLAIWAMLQFYVFQEYFGTRAHHPLANANSLAALFCLALYPTLGRVLQAPTERQKALALILAILLFGGIISTASRGAFLAFCALSPFFLYVNRRLLIGHAKYIAVFILCACALFISTNFVGTSGNVMSTRVVETLSFTSADISNNRFNIWTGAWGVVKENWLFGTGIGTFFLYYPEHQLAKDPFTAFFAHNDPLQYWAELGIAGFILFYLFVISFILRTIKALRIKNITDTQRTLIISCACAIGCIILHTHATFNFYNLSILYIIGFLLSVWFWGTEQVINAQKTTLLKSVTFPENTPNYARIALLSLPFIFLGTLFTAYISSEHITNKVRKDMIAGNFDTLANDIMRANNLSFDSNYRAYLIAVNIPMSLLEETSGKFSTEQKKDIYDQAIYYLNHVQAINPRSSAANYYLGKIQGLVPKSFLDGDMKSPETYYKTALRLDPKHIGSRIELATLYGQEERKDEELATLEGGVQYLYNSVYAVKLYEYLSRLYLEQNDAKNLQLSLQKINKIKKRIAKQQNKKAFALPWSE